MMLFIDFETRSAVDIRGAGAYRYASDLSTEVLMVGYAFDDGAVKVADESQLGNFVKGMRVYLRGSGKIVAHNAQFERLILMFVLGVDVPIERFICTAALARADNLPAKLDLCSLVLFGERKQADGAALIRLFSRPKKDGTFTQPEDEPEKWESMKEYCRKDVELERDIYGHFQGWGGLTASDYVVSERINDRGVRIDVPLAVAAAARERAIQTELKVELADITKGELESTRGVGRQRKWVYSHRGYKLRSAGV